MEKLLVIDDMPGVRRSIVAVLKREGYEIDEAENGAIGLEMCFSNQYGLVITDLLMPDTDGAHVIAMLRAKMGDLCPKLMAISGGGIAENTALTLSAVKNSVDAVLSKPFHKEELIRHVQTVLS